MDTIVRFLSRFGVGRRLVRSRDFGVEDEAMAAALVVVRKEICCEAAITLLSNPGKE